MPATNSIRYSSISEYVRDIARRSQVARNDPGQTYQAADPGPEVNTQVVEALEAQVQLEGAQIKCNEKTNELWKAIWAKDNEKTAITRMQLKEKREIRKAEEKKEAEQAKILGSTQGVITGGRLDNAVTGGAAGGGRIGVQNQMVARAGPSEPLRLGADGAVGRDEDEDENRGSMSAVKKHSSNVKNNAWVEVIVDRIWAIGFVICMVSTVVDAVIIAVRVVPKMFD